MAYWNIGKKEPFEHGILEHDGGDSWSRNSRALWRCGDDALAR